MKARLLRWSHLLFDQMHWRGERHIFYTNQDLYRMALERMQASFDAVAKALGDALRPVLEAMGKAINDFGQALVIAVSPKKRRGRDA